MTTRLINQRAPLLLAVVAAATLLVACGGDKGDKASQTAAKVNKEEITVHQINFVLQRQQGLKPEQAEEAGRQVLERLVDQELAVQKAQELKLDRDPRVVQQVEAAKREIIARAYAERIGESVAKPANDEIAKYYAEKPALFKERRIYSLQELNIEAKPEQFEALRAKLSGAKNIGEFVEFLKANDIRFAGNQAVRAAEQLPLASLDNIAKMKDGDSLLSPNPNGLTVLTLVGSRSQPVDEERARPAIEAFLLNQRRAEAIQKDLKALRDSSKIEYVGKFAQPAASAASAATPAQPAPAPASAASGLDQNAIAKGMGLK
ncbi:MAG: peptidyl-prolyl cis-trans isomerase, EpsD family [Proteobacteria bacterium]|jgi:EpsD family peptidyl-prolyl cis-trans isomerase|nr:peptidyl-prolyl cis-trans isomerase, EpsD family [Methylibium sp.]MBY0366166.1 EpsD family peptidyl-prolyl cis-trans isomerase [Burkholderiaceae bacterium]MCH8854902.1 peptidyl-prolyl cis-trans isomerase, EpsD family [Pseudomonadota bacterium]RTL24200.1 MAG: peptidyl-prolyl cis-trans isomerase, EpsD family [Burkholderiales bacterium]|mmetsp:Transcript_50958/g.119476  ORF Transcript_50958/g.119476 Transcript_50958/m.119476 type:complete len:319 (+) Transcript_50958:3059-4015(+)